MIDETNIHSRFTEPVKKMFFSKPKLREDHVWRHLIFGKKEEKWRHLEGFDTETIHAVEEGDFDALERLAIRYEEYLSETLLRCCKNGTDHQHFLYLYPEKSVPLLGLEDREPVQYVKCFLFSEKLVIIAASYVSNDHFLPYTIKTGYRVFSEKSKNAWLKEQKNRTDDGKAMYSGKEEYLVADHSEKQEA